MGRCATKRSDLLERQGKAFLLTIIEDLGFTLIGTQGTAAFYNSNGIKCDVVNKIGAGRPDIAYYEQGSLSGNQHSKS